MRDAAQKLEREMPEKFKVDTEVTADEIATSLESLAEALRKGSVDLVSNERHLSLHPFASVRMRLKAKSKSDSRKESLSLELTWLRAPDQTLEIVPTAAEPSVEEDAHQTPPGRAHRSEAAGSADGADEETHESESGGMPREIFRDATRAELYEKARVVDIAGRSTMSRRELTDSLADEPESVHAWTREELYGKAREAEIEGRSNMTKEELIEALRRHGALEDDA